ncbi:hypothetical protein BC941DRAFT_464137 [Chlamydoabsidia padenii]|nr:hypothetical protein BC941DRAFT_464137 [Chlamydoabsidia padenii]
MAQSPASISSLHHFYQSKILVPFMQQSIQASTFRQYINLSRHRTGDRDFQQLAFIVGTYLIIEWTYRIHWGAFEALRKTATIKTEQDNAAFCDMIGDLLDMIMPSD